MLPIMSKQVMMSVYTVLWWLDKLGLVLIWDTMVCNNLSVTEVWNMLQWGHSRLFGKNIRLALIIDNTIQIHIGSLISGWQKYFVHFLHGDRSSVEESLCSFFLLYIIVLVSIWTGEAWWMWQWQCVRDTASSWSFCHVQLRPPCVTLSELWRGSQPGYVS